MLVPAPDPEAVRKNTLEELFRLRLPLPPSTFALVWDHGDLVELRPRDELEARAAILNVVLARSFGMSQEAAMGCRPALVSQGSTRSTAGMPGLAIVRSSHGAMMVSPATGRAGSPACACAASRASPPPAESPAR